MTKLTATRQYADLPRAWDAVFNTAHKTALGSGGTGQVSVVFEGDSIPAGQGGGTQTDALIYGMAGRLETLLTAVYGNAVSAVGYTHAAADTASFTAPSAPFSLGTTASHFDGGVGDLVVPASASAGDLLFSCPAHRITGQFPSSADIYSSDWNTTLTWKWKIDSGGTQTTVSTTGTSNGTAGNGVLRKTSITLDGSAAHTIYIGTQSAGNAFMGAFFVTNYGTHGLALHRNTIQGWRNIDFSTGGGTTAGFGGRTSTTPDHIQPWAGKTVTNNQVGSGFPAPHLTIIGGGVNDATYGSRHDAYQSYLVRRIKAARSGRTNASVMLIDMAYPSIYSDWSSGRPYHYDQFKRIKRETALMYGCAYLDIDTLFGEAPIANGWLVTADIHPTHNGAGTGGGDGHLLIAQTIYNILMGGPY